MTDETSKLSAEIGRYGQNYLTLQVQDAADASADVQLAAVIPLIAEAITSYDDGAIIDVGCGNGSFLRRLIDLPVFKNSSGWTYVGIDEDEGLLKVQDVARAARLNRRTELLTLADFYSEWPDISKNQIVFCRNVLHELTIRDTSALIYHIRSNIGLKDKVIIQDLLKFPEAERHNVCWTPEALSACFVGAGFNEPNLIPQPTRSGNAFISLALNLHKSVDISKDEVETSVKQARLAQWNSWVPSDPRYTEFATRRADAVEAIDFDLQLAALTRQLADAGMLVRLPEPVTKRVRADQFTGLIRRAADDGLIFTGGAVDVSTFHFRERGAQLTKLEDYLRSDATLAQVHGGSGYGKTTVINRLIATRAYNKAVIRIDGRVVKTFWSFVESFFSQVNVRLAAEQLSTLDNLTVENTMPIISAYLNSHINNIIVFYDNFDDVTDSNHTITDRGLSLFLESIVKRPGAKVIIARKSEVVPRDLANSCVSLPEIVRVGRYASDDTVRNVLDDYFDRVAAKVNAYPDSLLQAIDRHPLIAALAAKILQREGARALHDSSFITQLKLRLRQELWNRMVDDGARPAVAAAAQLRIATPLLMLQKLATKESIASARENEIIYAQRDSRWTELLSVLGLFRLREVSNDKIEDVNLDEGNVAAVDRNTFGHVENYSALHYQISSLYQAVYRNDDDPKWIRESYFHQIMASGGRAENLPEYLGKYFSDELIGSADYYFQRARDYKGALHLYEKAAEIGALRENSEMRYASCLVRTGDLIKGDKVYTDLISRYPDSLGIKTSYIDALIYVRNFESAEKKLRAFGLEHQTDWVRWQWGRVYGGLDQYDKAIEALRPLIGKPDGDPHFHVHYARALRAFGDYAQSLRAIEDAERRFPTEVAVTTAAAVERMEHKVEGAEVQLEGLFAANQSNTRAAAVLIKVAIADGDHAKANRILYEARPSSPRSTQVLVDVSDAEILILKGQIDLAISKLKALVPEPIVYTTLLSAISLRERKASSEKRLVESEVLRLKSLDRYIKNVPVQIEMARLGHFIKSATLVDRAVQAIEVTAFPKDQLDELKSGAFFLEKGL